MTRRRFHVVMSAIAATIFAVLQCAAAPSDDAQQGGNDVPPQNQTDSANITSQQHGSSAEKASDEHAPQNGGTQGSSSGRGASGLHSTGITGKSSAGAQGKDKYAQPEARANLPPSPAMSNGVAQAGEQLATRGATDKGVVACNACHGNIGQGNSVSGFPRLTGFPEAYLRKQLHDYATGARAHPIMTPIAAGLTPEQRRNVAAYYAAQQLESTDVSESRAWSRSNNGQGNSQQNDNRLYTPPPAAGSKVANQAAPGGTAAATIDPVGASQQNDKAVHNAPVMPANPARARLLATTGDERLHAQACANCHGPDGIGLSPAYPPLAGQHASYFMAAMNEWRSGTRHNDASEQMPMIAKSLGDGDVAALASFYAGMPPAVAR